MFTKTVTLQREIDYLKQQIQHYQTGVLIGEHGRRQRDAIEELQQTLTQTQVAYETRTRELAALKAVCDTREQEIEHLSQRLHNALDDYQTLISDISRLVGLCR